MNVSPPSLSCTLAKGNVCGAVARSSRVKAVSRKKPEQFEKDDLFLFIKEIFLKDRGVY